MPRFIDPSGESTFGIGVCARCWRKFSLVDLFSDPNSPGLKVCLEDLDDYDPYRLPARRTEDITLPFYRPDEDLSIGGPVPNVISLFAIRETEGSSPSGNPRITADGNLRVLEGSAIPPIDEE